MGSAPDGSLFLLRHSAGPDLTFRDVREMLPKIFPGGSPA